MRNYRSPEAGWLPFDVPLELYMQTAVAVLEILSPDDETYGKFPHYAERGVTEILVAHPCERWITCRLLASTDYRERPACALFKVTMADLVTEVPWPS